MWEPEAVASWGGYYTMLEEVNQYRVDSKLKSYYKFEQEIDCVRRIPDVLRSIRSL